MNKKRNPNKLFFETNKNRLEKQNKGTYGCIRLDNDTRNASMQTYEKHPKVRFKKHFWDKIVLRKL